MTPDHVPNDHNWAPSEREKSALGTAVVAIVAYEVVSTAINDWLGDDLVPSVMPRVQAVTPKSVARAATPQWTRYAGWVAAGAAFTLAGRVARSAMPQRHRR